MAPPTIHNQRSQSDGDETEAPSRRGTLGYDKPAANADSGPEFQSVEVLRVAPDDIIVITGAERLDSKAAQELGKKWKAATGLANRVIVLTHSLKVSVVSNDEASQIDRSEP